VRIPIFESFPRSIEILKSPRKPHSGSFQGWWQLWWHFVLRFYAFQCTDVLDSAR